MYPKFLGGNCMKIKKKIEMFLNEILLYSGQYALFYIIMNFTKDGLLYFKDSGHSILLVVLILQTLFLIYFGNKPFLRFVGSLIVPLFYTVVEYKYDYQFLFNSAHVFFWIFSILVGTIQALQLKQISKKVKIVNEYLITILNVTAFLFIYFYFDLNETLKENVITKKITEGQYTETLQITYLHENIKLFLEDLTHWYIIFGGLFLAISIAKGRVKILLLSEQIKTLFGRYIDTGVRDRIISDGKGRAEKIEACILFSDLRNFTGISEKYEPEEITEMLNLYFTKWAEAANQFDGIIDKYIGDAVMIVFKKVENKSAVSNGLKCALKILSEKDKIKSELLEKNLPVFDDIGIGINFGTVIAGDIGGAERLNYTYIGDTVNTASRLESLCKEYNNRLIISEEVYSSLMENEKELFAKSEKLIQLKGKNQKTNIYLIK